MSSKSRGLCPPPFYQEDLFPSQGGLISGRFCQKTGPLSCCLPCPATDWTYSEGFLQRTEAVNWLNVAAMAATLFCLISFIVLPVKWTHRHYLSICLAFAVMFMELGFIVPLGSKPQQCFNAITPHDMRSDTSCAIAGASLLFGGWAAVLWVFWRALSLHLQICWEVIPGKMFFYAALVFGWGIPLAGLAVGLAVTGVSYRFGSTCHLNHENSLPAVWGPLLAFSAASLVVQGVTFGYCLQVYIRSLLDDATTDVSSQLPSYSGSVRTRTARQALARIKRVIQLQWRGVMVVLVIVAEVIFFSVVYISMDNTLVATATHPTTLKPWVTCLIASKGDRDKCLPLVKDYVENEATIIAVLVFLSLSGFWLLLLLGRWSMVLGWIDLIKRRLIKKNEFVSADAKRLSIANSQPPGTPYLKSPTSAKYDALSISSPMVPSPITSPAPTAARSPPSSRAGHDAWGSPYAEKEREARVDYFGREAKYTSPATSFSSPRPPSANAVYHSHSSSASRGWDAYAREASQTHSYSLNQASLNGGRWAEFGRDRDRAATFSTMGLPNER